MIYIGDPANGVYKRNYRGLNYSNGRIVGGSFGDDDDDNAALLILATSRLMTMVTCYKMATCSLVSTMGKITLMAFFKQMAMVTALLLEDNSNVTFPDGTVVTGTVDADGNVTDANGNIIGTWDGTTFTKVTALLPLRPFKA